MRKLRSRVTVEGLDRAPHRAFMRAMGLDDSDIAKPMIGVVSQKGEQTPCNMTHDFQVDSAKTGISEAGGTPPASVIPVFAASTWKSWVILQGVCSPFWLTTPIIGLAMSASSRPIARMKARCGARSSPSVVTRDRSFFIPNVSPQSAPTFAGARSRPVPRALYWSGATIVGCLNWATSIFGSMPVSA